MRIGIDACCWSNRRGFGRFTRELLSAVAAENSGHELTFMVDRATAIDGEFPANVRLQIVETREQPTVAASASGSRSLRDLWRMSRAVRKSAFDLFYFPAVYSYFPVPGSLPAIVTLHDVIAETHPNAVFSSHRARLFWSLKVRHAVARAARLVTVSHDARTRIARTFRLQEKEIAIVGEGAASIFRKLPPGEIREMELRQKYRLPAHVPLLLAVGGLSPHKNLDRLLLAMKELLPREVNWHLVLAGDYERDSFLGCHGDLRRIVEAEGLSDRVTFTGFVPNDELVRLYHAATLLVMPSLDEGFGLPAVEAMACGLPVACSNRGSLPEVTGGAALLFDPLSKSDIGEKLLQLLRDEELRRRLSAAGVERMRRYSWSESARQLLAVFEETFCAV